MLRYFIWFSLNSVPIVVDTMNLLEEKSDEMHDLTNREGEADFRESFEYHLLFNLLSIVYR